jgi:hypothetical protein
VTDSEFHSKSLGAVMMKSGVRNISREAKQTKMSATGLMKCKFSNVPIAESITKCVTNERNSNAFYHFNKM